MVSFRMQRIRYSRIQKEIWGVSRGEEGDGRIQDTCTPLLGEKVAGVSGKQEEKVVRVSWIQEEKIKGRIRIQEEKVLGKVVGVSMTQKKRR
jgi:hypothetical protein